MSKVLMNKETRWTPRLIKQLRRKRSLVEFAASVGASRNTVTRWEAGYAAPNSTHSEGLSELAEREHFLEDWKLVGSMALAGDLESAKAEIAELFRSSVERTARQLAS